MSLKKQIRRLLKEETQGIDNLITELSSLFVMSEELKEFVKKFINDSKCNKIEFENFKMGAMGIALHDFVLINKLVLKKGLEYSLFVIFHETAHQYQFKKYGEKIMYHCYIGDISDDEAALFMKKTEEVADKFADGKIKQLQKMGLIDQSFKSPTVYKNMSLSTVKYMVSNLRNNMKKNKIDSPQKISEYFYNMVKSEL